MTEELKDSSSNGLNLHALLRAMMDYEASDLHITTGSPPQLRIDGSLTPIKTDALRPGDTQRLCYSVLSEEQRAKFEEEKELDFSFGLKNMARFRANFSCNEAPLLLPFVKFRLKCQYARTGYPRGDAAAGTPVIGLGFGHRADWIWKVDDAGLCHPHAQP